jgi:hypothetical protein
MNLAHIGLPFLVFGLSCGGEVNTPAFDASDAERDATPGERDATPAVDAKPVAPGATLSERLDTTVLPLPQATQAGVSNWRVWGRSSLGVSPVFTVPLSNCETLVGYTGSDGNARAIRIAAGATSIVETHALGAGLELRGLAAEPTGEFGALLWDDANDKIYVHRFTPAGAPSWQEELTNASNTPTDFGIGDSRLEFGDGKYGAYYHVHSDTGHEGDTLKWITSAGTETTGWSWGCSHSKSALARYNGDTNKFMPACVTDCYPGTSGSDFQNNSIGGIYINHNAQKVMDVAGGCNGSVAAELGAAANSPDGWKLGFNAHQAAATMGQASYDSGTMNQDVGFVSVADNYAAGSVVWLTSTASVDEEDVTMARWTPEGASNEQYIVGWAESATKRQLAIVDAAGVILDGPTEFDNTLRWGHRDDPMRRHYDGDVVWSWFESAGSSDLHFARIESGQTPVCASY